MADPANCVARFMLPIEQVCGFVEDMQQQLQGLYPLWLLPMRNTHVASSGGEECSVTTAWRSGGESEGGVARSKLVAENAHDAGVGASVGASGAVGARRAIFGFAREATGHLCNVGVYGIPQCHRPLHYGAGGWGRGRGRGRSYRFEEANRALEHLLGARGGRKVFYSHAFYTRDAFYGQLYDGARYFDLRSRYCPDGAFPEIFDKVITKNGSSNLLSLVGRTAYLSITSVFLETFFCRLPGYLSQYQT